MRYEERITNLAKHTLKSLIQRLSQAGFKKPFVEPAILPDWWDDQCAADETLLPEIEVRVARFLGLPISTIRDPALPLPAPSFPTAQLRRVRDVNRDRLAAAIHAAIQIAGAVISNLRDRDRVVGRLPTSGLEWQKLVSPPGHPVVLDLILGDLWARGIPVIPVGVLPTPSFQGAACIVHGRPVILIVHKHDEPGRIAFIVSHEAGHVAAGDCAPNQPVVDGEVELADDNQMEAKADLFATHVLVGTDRAPLPDGANFKELATKALKLEQETGADASMIISAWASQTGDYARATMAVKALYRATGAWKKVREHFDRNVDIASANETDRGLLRCVWADAEIDVPAD